MCGAQVRALVHLGADACIVGRNVEKTERVAKDIASVRLGAKVIGIGAVDVRKIESLQASVERCVKELGGIDFVMSVIDSSGKIYGNANSLIFAVLAQQETFVPRSTRCPLMLSRRWWTFFC